MKKEGLNNVYIYFDNEIEFDKALTFLKKNRRNAQMMGYGTLEMSNTSANILKEAGFTFKKVETIQEVYENEELEKYWDELIETKYGTQNKQCKNKEKEA